ncbi:unnamed protein product [Blepharisma stoltei]|uniref:RRM domain-containing protein n=1 Tax=Blepharisma stoltei TaxID=1481888 RepID=A0AAU9JJW3_9CILI|nr:unnamed protein product [Blepharisma stoltei]
MGGRKKVKEAPENDNEKKVTQKSEPSISGRATRSMTRAAGNQEIVIEKTTETRKSSKSQKVKEEATENTQPIKKARKNQKAVEIVDDSIEKIEDLIDQSKPKGKSESNPIIIEEKIEIKTETPKLNKQITKDVEELAETKQNNIPKSSAKKEKGVEKIEYKFNDEKSPDKVENPPPKAAEKSIEKSTKSKEVLPFPNSKKQKENSASSDEDCQMLTAKNIFSKSAGSAKKMLKTLFEKSHEIPSSGSEKEEPKKKQIKKEEEEEESVSSESDQEINKKPPVKKQFKEDSESEKSSHEEKYEFSPDLVKELNIELPEASCSSESDEEIVKKSKKEKAEENKDKKEEKKEIPATKNQEKAEVRNDKSEFLKEKVKRKRQKRQKLKEKPAPEMLRDELPGKKRKRRHGKDKDATKKQKTEESTENLNLKRVPDQNPATKLTKPNEKPTIPEVFITGLSYKTTDSDIHELFKNCGEISSMKLLRNEKGFKGSAFIMFKSIESAEEAIKLSNTEFSGRVLNIRFSHEKSPKPRPYKGVHTIFIGNIPCNVDEDCLYSFFKKCGEIKEARIAVDSNGNKRGFAHLEFESVEAADAAIELSGKILDGKILKIDYSEDRIIESTHNKENHFTRPPFGKLIEKAKSGYKRLF